MERERERERERDRDRERERERQRVNLAEIFSLIGHKYLLYKSFS